MMTQRLRSNYKIKSDERVMNCFFSFFALSNFFFSFCFMFAALIGRVPFHFLELVQMREFIHYAIMSRAIRNTNPFCLLSFSLASIFSLTPKIVHTTYCEWFTLDTRHSDSCTQTQIWWNVSAPNNSQKREYNFLRLNPYMHVAYSCLRYADRHNQ